MWLDYELNFNIGRMISWVFVFGHAVACGWHYAIICSGSLAMHTTELHASLADIEAEGTKSAGMLSIYLAVLRDGVLTKISNFRLIFQNVATVGSKFLKNQSEIRNFSF